ncbi:hypothetical protein [Nitrincola alkalilacustris]|uniref:hypothetical protein n=1 Tax=Nitrincola alkalilacustris TaxID=1571224 RepID=UPI00124D04E6|nr:hypothetical protein [Nitrincola alkalilacustris]
MTSYKDENNNEVKHESIGVIDRILQGLSEKLGISRKFIIVFLVLIMLVNFPLAVLLVILSYFWIEHPGKFDSSFSSIIGYVKRLWSGESNKDDSKTNHTPDINEKIKIIEDRLSEIENK